MQKLSILLIITISISVQPAMCAETHYPSEFMNSVFKSHQEIKVGVENLTIDGSEESVGDSSDFIFDIFLENTSAEHKKDLHLPIIITLQDEFGNQYQHRSISIAGNKDVEMLSLYPGERIQLSCRYQLPVQKAEVLSFEIADASDQFHVGLNVLTNQIKNWESFIGKYELLDEDLIIVYPRDKKIFSPGETVFLKLNFSNRLGRPSNIHIMLPDYILTDDQARGSYELKVPQDYQDNDLQVVVMAEWGEPADRQIISKTLVLQIKG